MHKFSLSLFTLSLGVALMPLAHAATTPVQEHLLEQVRLGEASKREDLVRQSLYRLELIDPNNPDVVAARMRYLLRQGDTAGAKQQLERLAKLAPESPELKASRDEMKSSTGDGRQELQQARLLGVAGRLMRPSPLTRSCLTAFLMMMMRRLSTGRWWRGCPPVITKASIS